jgi:hypothetical protein
MLIDVRLQPGQGVIEPPQPKSHHHHAANGARPAGSDPATDGSVGGRRDDAVRQGG